MLPCSGRVGYPDRSRGGCHGLDRAVGGNEHHHGVENRMSVTDPGSVPAGPPATNIVSFASSRSLTRSSTAVAASSFCRSNNTGVDGVIDSGGPWRNSAALCPIAGTRRISATLSAISRDAAKTVAPSDDERCRGARRYLPRPTSRIARARQTHRQTAGGRRRGRHRARAPPPAARPQSSTATTVLVAATECSAPAPIGRTSSDAAAAGESCIVDDGKRQRAELARHLRGSRRDRDCVRTVTQRRTVHRAFPEAG